MLGYISRPLPAWVFESGGVEGTPSGASDSVGRSVSAVLHSRLHLAHGPTLAQLKAACAREQANGGASAGTPPPPQTGSPSGSGYELALAGAGTGTGSVFGGAGSTDPEPDYAALLRHYARAADFMLNPAERAVATAQHADRNAFAEESAARDSVELEAFEAGIDLDRARERAEAADRKRGELFRGILGGVAVVASLGVVAYGFSRQWAGSAKGSRKR